MQLARHLSATFGLLIGAALPVLCAEPTGQVQIVPSPGGTDPKAEVTYEIRATGCQIQWTVARTGVNAGIAQHRANCDLSLQEQVALIGGILDRVVRDEPMFRTVFLGRLAKFPELSVRLAAIVKRSTGWDSQIGRPSGVAPIDGYLKNVLSSDVSVFREWRDLFEARHFSVVVSGVEEVSVEAAGKLPSFRQLGALGVSATDRVPFDCLVWLSVARSK